MFTAMDKALVALIGALVYLASNYLGADLAWLTPDAIQNVVTVVTPILVWLVPNKAAA